MKDCNLNLFSAITAAKIVCTQHKLKANLTKAIQLR